MFHAMPPLGHTADRARPIVRTQARTRAPVHRRDSEMPATWTGSASCAGVRRRSWVRVDPQTREGSHGDQREEPAERNHRVRVAARRDGESTIDVNGATVVAAITKESAERLELAEGQSVVAIVKATDVMIGIAPV
jgi:molybdopterin-binding protein